MQITRQHAFPIFAIVAALLGLGGWGGRMLAKPATVVAEQPPSTTEARTIAPSSMVAAPTTPTWSGVTVTVVCPLATSDDSLKAACPDYFTTSWQAAAARDGYSTGSQKLAKVDCGMDHLSQLDELTRTSLTCRDGLNAAIYGKDGKGGGACATEIATCKTHPSPGTNPTDLCLQGYVTDGDPSTNLSPGCATAVANHKYAEDQVKAAP